MPVTSSGGSLPAIAARPYPAISLSDAVKYAQAVYERAMGLSVNAAILSRAWSAASTGPELRSIFDSLAQYGLMKQPDTGHKRPFALSPRALNIVHGPSLCLHKRGAALRAAAISPEVHTDLWKRFGSTVFSEDASASMTRHLINVSSVWDCGPLTQSDAKKIYENYKDSVKFAELDVLIDEGYRSGVKSRAAAQLMNSREFVFPIEGGDVEIKIPSSLSKKGVLELQQCFESVMMFEQCLDRSDPQNE